MVSSIFAVGDIHGRLDLLEPLIEDIAASPHYRPDSRIVFLGDYVDRGPAVAGVLERLSSLASEGFDPVFLVGNHELGMLAFLDDPELEDLWLHWGGVETALSYGVRGLGSVADPKFRRHLRDQLAAAIPAHHLAFLKSLKLYHIELGTLFVHAGIRPGVPLEEQTVDDLTFIRYAFLDDERQHPWYIVHGHTPVPQPDIRANRANIDTGAFATGLLSCLVVTPERRFLLERPRR
jgi:serine/threonine protein phosphatase 1